MGREGDVLSRGAILKADHFPGCQRKGLKVCKGIGKRKKRIILIFFFFFFQLEVEGAPNLREVEGYGVFGVAIPTVPGVRNTLQELKKLKESRGEKQEVRGLKGDENILISHLQKFCFFFFPQGCCLDQFERRTSYLCEWCTICASKY